MIAMLERSVISTTLITTITIIQGCHYDLQVSRHYTLLVGGELNS